MQDGNRATRGWIRREVHERWPLGVEGDRRPDKAVHVASVTAMRLAGLGQQAKSRVLIEEGRTHDQRIAEQSNKRAHGERNEDHHDRPPLAQGCSTRSPVPVDRQPVMGMADRKSTRLNSSHEWSSYAVFCLKKK